MAKEGIAARELPHLAIIPARGGSKGIPRKNIIDVAGKPLIAWSIVAALAARTSLRLVVTTDSEEIRRVAMSFGAEAPFLRPVELARDETPGVLPLLHALEWLEEHEGYRPETVLCLQPTSPLRIAEDIDCAFALLAHTGADSIVSVTEASPHPYLAKRPGPSGWLSDFVAREKGIDRRQDFPPALALNGAVYLIRTNVLRKEHTLFPERTGAHLMPAERSLDIDTPWDLHLARLILGDEESHERLHASRVA